MRKIKGEPQTNMRSTRPAIDPDVRMMEIAGKAVNLVEQRIEEGTATAAEVTYFLNYASGTSKLKDENIRLNNELTRMKTQAIQKEQDIESMLKEAMDAMSTYQGRPKVEVLEDEVDGY